MYSRNITVPDQRSNIRMNPNMRFSRDAAPQIPVKSYTDTSAYEHFDSLGEKDKAKTQNVASEEIPQDIPEDDNVACFTETLSNESSKSTQYSSDNQALSLVSLNEEDKSDNNADSILKTISKLWSNFEKDSIILIAAAALLYFSSKEDRNSITPLALISIAFL